MPSIVQLAVTQTVAAAPNTLQATGALLSQGATTLATGTTSLLTQASSLTALLAAPLALSSLVWTSGTVLATASAAIPGLTTGDTFSTTIASAAPSGYNGTIQATVTGSDTFTFPLTTDPGTETSAGTYTPPNQVELLAMVSTFFGQGAAQSVYVLELGAGDGTSGPPALATWITANPNVFYGYLVPRSWDATSAYLALIAQYEALTSKTYFFTTTTSATYTAYTSLMKNVLWLIEAPSIPTTEFSLAAAFQHALAYAPSSGNQMTPFAFSYLYGVTPYPQQGNNAFLTQIKNANGNYVGTGQEGGISTAVLFWGSTADRNDFTYWYSVDWAQINGDQTLANVVINGSNNPQNPLWYSQNGINQLQDAIVQLMKNAVAYALSTATVTRTTLSGTAFSTAIEDGDYPNQDVVNAIPFTTYIQQNPSSYQAGTYGGIQVAFIPARGFKQIILNLNVSSLPVS